MNKTLENHSYVDISVVGNSASDNVQCHTDLSSCCSTIEGFHRGQWYFPNGTIHWKTVMNMLPINIVYFGELNFVVTVVLGQLVSIGVRFKLKTLEQERQFMWDYIYNKWKKSFL